MADAAAAAKPKPAKRIGARGTADATMARKESALATWKSFRGAQEPGSQYDVPFDELPGSTLSSFAFYETLAFWIVHEYRITKPGKHEGKPLGADSAIQYWATFINVAQDKFGNKPETSEAAKHFFQCLNHSVDSAPHQWLMRVKRNMGYQSFQASTQKGDRTDWKAASLYPKDAWAMVAQYVALRCYCFRRCYCHGRRRCCCYYCYCYRYCYRYRYRYCYCYCYCYCYLLPTLCLASQVRQGGVEGGRDAGLRHPLRLAHVRPLRRAQAHHLAELAPRRGDGRRHVGVPADQS